MKKIVYLCNINFLPMQFSIIVPVYNRPQEIDELLRSLCEQTYHEPFEVIAVDDGSITRCEEQCARYAAHAPFAVRYFYKENGGPGPARNYGAARAQGEYLLILDSDVVLPKGYLQAVADELQRQPADAFGGPDRAHADFTPIQKAISYAMTSFFTTGGIRGGKKKLDKFYPRSFNLGIRRSVFAALGGFAPMRFGEDIDLSIRIFRRGYTCRLFPEAWVWHKRRATFRQFFKQVHNSGIARIVLYRKYPDSLKIVHLLPACFTIGVAALLLLFLAGVVLLAVQAAEHQSIAPYTWWLLLIPVALLAGYSALLFADSALQNKSLLVGGLSIAAAFVQLTGYGTGFLRAVWHCLVLGEQDFQAFRKTFYK